MVLKDELVQSLRLQACLGVHTGSVVIDPLEGADQRLYTAVGATTHLATRLQSLAAPGTVVLSDTTYQLVRHEAQSTAIGNLTVTETAAPIAVYMVQELGRRRAGVSGRGARNLSRFVGRVQELAVLYGSSRPEVTIGLIEGPVMMNHPGLANQHVREIPGNGSSACTHANSTACLHGTFVAGILFAKRGSVAPAICPNCTLVVAGSEWCSFLLPPGDASCTPRVLTARHGANLDDQRQTGAGSGHRLH